MTSPQVVCTRREHSSAPRGLENRWRSTKMKTSGRGSGLQSPAEPCRARSPKNYCLLSGQETSVPRATLPWPQSGSCQDQKLQLVTPEPYCPCCDLSQRHSCPRGCSQTHKPGPRHQTFPCRPLLAAEMQRQERSVHLAPSFQTSRQGI